MQAQTVSQANTHVSGDSTLQAPAGSLADSVNKVKFPSGAYGYSIDDGGYMGADFNAAAGLPTNFKIHKSSLDEIAEYNEATYTGTLGQNVKTFDNIDMADTIGKYYKIFQGVMGENLRDSYDEAALAKLPRGFSHAGDADIISDGDYLADVGKFKLKNIYKTQAQLDEALSVRDELGARGVALSVTPLDLSAQGLNKRTHFSPSMAPYKTEDGYTQAGVFMGFLKGMHPRASDSGETRLSAQAIASSAYNIEETAKWTKQNDIDFFKIAEEEAAVAELLKRRSKSLATEIFASPKDKEAADKKLAERINALMSQTAV